MSNEEDEPQAVLNYTKEPTPTILLVYRTPYSFYVIIIHSKLPLDENIINIFDLR